MKRETWMAITAALGLAALGGVWFAVKAPALADPGEPAARPAALGDQLRLAPARRFYAPSIDPTLLEAAARRPMFNARRESYGTAASLALHPVANPDPTFTLAPLREPPGLRLPADPAAPTALAAPANPTAPAAPAAVIETSALAPPAAPPQTPAPAARPAATPAAPAQPAAAAPARPAAPQAPIPAAPLPTPAPPPAVGTPAMAPPIGPSAPPTAMALAGVFPRADGGSAVLIRLPDNSIVEGGVGSSVAGWRIESSTPFSATLWNGRDRITIRLPGR